MTLPALIVRLTELEKAAQERCERCERKDKTQVDFQSIVSKPFWPDKEQDEHDKKHDRMLKANFALFAEAHSALPLLLEALAIQREALEEMQAHLCDSTSDKTCSQMWYQDVISETIARVDALASKEGAR